MKIEIINKPMLCWDNDEADAREYHVLAKVTECDTEYQFKVIYTKNSVPNHPEYAGLRGGVGFKNVKPIPKEVEMTVAEISKALGKTVKIVE